MLSGRCLATLALLALGAMAVPAHAATIQIVMENLVISPAEVSAKAGTVDYYCRYHPNMKAVLTIAP